MLKEISIEIIRRCPNHCLHCSSQSDIKCTEILPIEKFKEIVRDAAKIGAGTICLSGGEPFLHEDLPAMVKFVTECGLDSYIYTSGITLDQSGGAESISFEVLKELSGYATKIIFNIEAGSEKTYNRIMGTKDCFSKMQQSVLRVVEAGICAEAHFVPMAVNIDEIDSVIRLCEKLHISRLSFLRLVIHGRAEQNRAEIALGCEDEMRLKKYLESVQEQSGIAVRIGVPLSLDTSCHRCEAAKGKLNIKYDGNVYPCEVFKNCSMNKNLGGLNPDNIYERSLAEIYQRSQYLHRVRKLSEDFSGSDGCETCVGQYIIKAEEGG